MGCKGGHFVSFFMLLFIYDVIMQMTLLVLVFR